MLDTNLNNEKNDENYQALEPEKKEHSFLNSSFATIMMILLLAILSVSSYAPIKNNILFTENHVKSYTESDDFSYTLGRLTYYLKETKLLKNNGWYDHGLESLDSIKYHISTGDRVNALKISNMDGVADYQLHQEIKNSQFHLQVKFDMEGKPEIESSAGNKLRKDAFLRSMMDRNGNYQDYAGLNITYIIPKDISGYSDVFTNNVKEFHVFPGYMLLIVAIGAAGIIILAMAAISVPYAVQSRHTMSRLFNKMYLEFKILLLIGFLAACLGGAVEISRYYYINGLYNIVDIIYNADSFFYLIGIPVTFILYLFIYLIIVYTKFVYYEGFKEGFIRNSIIGRIACYVFNKIYSTVKEVINIDLDNEGQRQLLMVLGINLVTLWIIAATGFLGFLLAIAYSIFIFKYLIKLITDAKAINEASRQLAAGDFTISLDEDSGIFSPIAKNLNNIKEGFKLAVNKEIKSQKMKAELISNVSHDLKTPLTSIINYVDLLKKEDTTAERQKEYIDILDQKSQRLKVLIEDLFEASKASSGNIDLYLGEVDVIALFRQTLGELEEKINQSTLDFKTNIPENRIICTLDGKKTYRVFENIISNILKYAMPNTRVYIEVTQDEEEVGFTFKNISAYEMNFDPAEITERFTRGDKSRNSEGSGLGLAIAKGLIELQNGDLQITIDGDLFKITVSFPKTGN
ncbi:MAG: HAMP domain-containing sensor histidine kinase [Bacillota bacterium]|nr:HAMP domain-containing sensor histidine kinase [Bacillota bacterium]